MNISNIASNRNLCCGCNACAEICPKKAIQMVADQCGHYYPVVDSNKCIDCSLCSKACCESNLIIKRFPIDIVAASNKNITTSARSSSGGIFAALADSTLSEAGIVYGTAYNKQFEAIVVGIESHTELYLLQGSKYVHSKMGAIYHDIEDNLKRGRKVLFSGVPCQVAAVKTFLLKDYDNLFTVDIVCHGVPSCQMFLDYLSLLQEKKKAEIVEFHFRDKKYGQDTKGKVLYKQNRLGKVLFKQNRLASFQSSYYKLFLNCSTLRDCCYYCKFACPERVGDISLCDYWGIEEVHPEFVTKVHSSGLCGISAIMVNSKKGLDELERIKDKLIQIPTNYDSVRKRNPQLNKPSKKTPEHDEVMQLYKDSGYKAVDNYYQKKYRLKIFSSTVGQILSNKTKKKILNIRRKFGK